MSKIIVLNQGRIVNGIEYREGETVPVSNNFPGKFIREVLKTPIEFKNESKRLKKRIKSQQEDDSKFTVSGIITNISCPSFEIDEPPKRTLLSDNSTIWINLKDCSELIRGNTVDVILVTRNGIEIATQVNLEI